MPPRTAPVMPSLRALLAVALCAAALSGCSPSTEDVVRDALALVPAVAAERTVLVTLGPPSAGFGTVLPRDAIGALLGLEDDDIRALAETGGAPFTAVIADIDPTEARAAARDRGYTDRQIAGWWVLRPSPDADGALPAAVPALAVRRGEAILGSAEEVAAVVDGAPVAAGLDWMAPLLEAVAEEDLAIAYGTPGPIGAAVAASDESLPPPTPDAPALRTYAGFALVWGAEEEGRILLAGLEGGPGFEDAAALATAVATGRVLDGRRHAADVVEGGAPRADAAIGIVTLPVSWLLPPGELRTDVEGGHLAFLLPR